MGLVKRIVLFDVSEVPIFDLHSILGLGESLMQHFKRIRFS